MKIKDYKKTFKCALRPRTVTFLIKESKVLLGYKKRGFGQGNWLGIGGKVEKGENIEESAERELGEEIAIKNPILSFRGVLRFYFPHIQDESWNQEVHIFVADTWQQEPSESEEIRPQWCDLKSIPYELMWDDAKYWLPLVLSGKKVDAEFTFNKDLKVMDHIFFS